MNRKQVNQTVKDLYVTYIGTTGLQTSHWDDSEWSKYEAVISKQGNVFREIWTKENVKLMSGDSLRKCIVMNGNRKYIELFRFHQEVDI